MNTLLHWPTPPSLRTWGWALALLLFAAPVSALAQAEETRLPVGVELEATRSALEAALNRLGGNDVDGMADIIRLRLSAGDFRPGDQVALTVTGEPDLTGTFTVEAGPVLPLPLAGEVPLSGVLRSELEGHLTEALARVIRNPTVRARSLIQLSILGEVTRPGFYVVTPDALLSEAFMEAGGPTQEAKMEELRIERAEAGAWIPSEAVVGSLESLSVNQLGLRNGDRILVPGDSGISGSQLAQISILGLSAIVTIFTVF
ncbi:MAG: polysaccharide biosynthesis/export family protein [Longimicrobiales bacterium]|nr:polysaccharide biosynthesis/export family protein [Longimicrobiales bacterium]